MISTPLRVAFGDRQVDLLDGPSVGELLRDALPLGEAGSAEPQDVRVERCWPIGRSGTAGFVFEWSFQVGPGRRYSVYGQLGSRGRPPPPANPFGNGVPRPSLTRDGVRGLALEVSSAGLSVRSPDCDPLLPQMSICLDRRRMAARLSAFGMRTDAPTGGRTRSLRCQLGGYRPGRRAAIRFGCGDATGGAVHLCGKTFRDLRGKDLLQLHLSVSEELRRLCGGRVRVPSPVGFDDELRLALFYWMPGVPASTMSSTPEVVVDAAVEALCAIHDLPVGKREEFTSGDECAIVQRWAAVLAHLMPAIGEEANELATRLSSLAGAVQSGRPVTIHRDFYEKQLMVSPQCLTVLDLDTMARGDACVDLGNFLAHQLLRALVKGDQENGFTRHARTVVEKYEARRERLDPPNLAFYTASALFRLGAVHALRTTTARHHRALWTAAEHFLDRGAFDSLTLSGASQPREAT